MQRQHNTLLSFMTTHIPDVTINSRAEVAALVCSAVLAFVVFTFAEVVAAAVLGAVEGVSSTVVSTPPDSSGSDTGVVSVEISRTVVENASATVCTSSPAAAVGVVAVDKSDDSAVGEIAVGDVTEAGADAVSTNTVAVVITGGGSAVAGAPVGSSLGASSVVAETLPVVAALASSGFVPAVVTVAGSAGNDAVVSFAAALVVAGTSVVPAPLKASSVVVSVGPVLSSTPLPSANQNRTDCVAISTGNCCMNG